jgi:hypothetical protein
MAGEKRAFRSFRGFVEIVKMCEQPEEPVWVPAGAQHLIEPQQIGLFLVLELEAQRGQYRNRPSEPEDKLFNYAILFVEVVEQGLERVAIRKEA